MILITGGAGYIGSHVNVALNDAGYKTIVLDDLSLGHKELVPVGELVVGDFGDRELLDEIFGNYRIEAVVHLAAFTDVDDSLKRPSDYYDNNVKKTLTLLQAMLDHGVNTFLFSSTSAVYADDAEVPYTEESPLNPLCVYGRTKLFVEHILNDYHNTYGLKYAAFRYFNAAGADPKGRVGEWHEPEPHLIPVVLEVAEGRRDHIKIFGTDYPTRDGSCIRDFIHVMDIADAHIRALEYLREGGKSGPFNLGYGMGTSVIEVIEMCRKITSHPIPAIPHDRRPGDGAVSIADCSKAFNEMGWQPKHGDLEDIISTAWAWQQKLAALRERAAAEDEEEFDAGASVA